MVFRTVQTQSNLVPVLDVALLSYLTMPSLLYSIVIRMRQIHVQEVYPPFRLECHHGLQNLFGHNDKVDRDISNTYKGWLPLRQYGQHAGSLTLVSGHQPSVVLPTSYAIPDLPRAFVMVVDSTVLSVERIDEVDQQCAISVAD